MKRLILLPLLLAACDPQAVTDSVSRRAAKTVILPVVQQYMPGPQAEGVTTCLIDNATTGELSSLARDVGTRAGTTTVQTVLGIARRPEAQSCILQRGLPGLPA